MRRFAIINHFPPKLPSVLVVWADGSTVHAASSASPSTNSNAKGTNFNPYGRSGSVPAVLEASSYETPRDNRGRMPLTCSFEL